MPLLIALVLFAVPCTMTFRWYGRIAKYRTDIAPGTSPAAGESRYWVLNIIRPSNYSTDGQGPLRHFWFWAALWQVAIIVDVVILGAAYT
jgi:hypothetical protein